MKTNNKNQELNNNNQENSVKKTQIPFDLVTFPDGQRFLMLPMSKDIEIIIREYSIKNPSVEVVKE